MRLPKLKSFLLFLYLFCFSISTDGQLPVFQIDSIKSYESLATEYGSYWIDESEQMDIQSILQKEASLDFQPIGAGIPNVKKVFWAKWQFQNVMKDPGLVKDWILDIGKGDYVSTYMVNSSGQIVEQQQVGEFVPMSKKQLNKRHFVERIPFSLYTNEVMTMYIRLQRVSGFPPKIRLSIHQQDFYYREGYQDKVPQRWLFFGMLFTFAFLGLICYPITRDKAFLYFGLFLFSVGLYMVDAFFNIFGNVLFFRESPKLVMFFTYGIVTLMNVSHLMFIREYIASRANFPKWDRMARVVLYLNIAMGVVAWGIYGFTFDEFFTDQIIIPFIILTYLFLFTVMGPILRYRKWSVENLLIFTSLLLFMLAIIINAISILKGTNMRLVETQLILTLVILIFAVGLTSGLAYRFVRHQRKQLELVRLKDLNDMKARFYQNITHEFRTPLTVISGVTKEIQQDAMISRSPDISKKVEMINRNGNNLLELVNRLLEMAKLETGMVKLKMAKGDVIRYIRYLVESIGSFADSRKVRLQYLTNLEEMTMDFDSEKLRQVLYNLMSNAVKFSNENGVVKIFAEKVNYKGQQHLLIKVKDDGVGISKKDLPQVFDRFYQGDKGKVTVDQGSGIGLAYVKELLSLMKGNILLESELGKGTVVEVYLPITTDAPVRQQEVVSRPKVEEDNKIIDSNTNTKPTFLPEGETKPLILLVEDNWDVLEYVKGILDKKYEVAIARDGQEGIDKALELIPDLIISDVMMPHKTGFELTAELKNDERSSHIPIIILTAKDSDEAKLTGLLRGADVYLTKPFSKEELEIRIHNILALRQKQQEQWLRAQSTGNKEVGSSENAISEKDQAFLNKLSDFINTNIAEEDMDVARMQRAVQMSRPQLHRKLKALTGLSAAKFRKKLRLEKAYILLQSDEDKTMAEIAYAVGYKHASHFSSDFKAAYGLSPGEVN
ncbi:MAG: signal transduction histidine kinase/DNA-binding response OmpR family regulator [Polaribacter sp.]|jgi:signal transduction histidine kinase/DNA-binding response OmpR family regulator